MVDIPDDMAAIFARPHRKFASSTSVKPKQGTAPAVEVATVTTPEPEVVPQTSATAEAVAAPASEDEFDNLPWEAIPDDDNVGRAAVATESAHESDSGLTREQVPVPAQVSAHDARVRAMRDVPEQEPGFTDGPPAQHHPSPPPPVPVEALSSTAEVALVDEVNATLRPLGYPWPGGIVLTELDDPRVQHTMEVNAGFGILVKNVGWVSLLSPRAGLILPDNVPLEPVPNLWGDWVHLVGAIDGKIMGLIALDARGRVVGAAGTQKRRDLAVPLTMAMLRTLEDADDIPSTAGALVDPDAEMSVNWTSGWVMAKGQLLHA